jgi:hypothetical protein
MKHLKLFEAYHVSDYYRKVDMTAYDNRFGTLIREREIDIEPKYIDIVKNWKFKKDVGEITVIKSIPYNRAAYGNQIEFRSENSVDCIHFINNDKNSDFMPSTISQANDEWFGVIAYSNKDKYPGSTQAISFWVCDGWEGVERLFKNKGVI